LPELKLVEGHQALPDRDARIARADADGALAGGDRLLEARQPQQPAGIDALKLRSCLTLFEAVAPDEALFARLLDAYYGGQRDSSTLALLRG
jgi:Protein of unknown function (DUF1810)